MASRLRLFGHPLHPATTHAPLALLMVMPVWDMIGWYMDGGVWWSMAYWSGIAGVIASIPAFITGILEFSSVPTRALTVAIAHLMTMGAVVIIYLISLLALHGYQALPHAAHPLGALITDAIAAVVLILGGWLGGHLVFGHGVGLDDPTLNADRRDRHYTATSE